MQAQHAPDRRDAVGSRASDLAAGRARTGRPRFTRVHASIAARQSDWAWGNCLDKPEALPLKERIGAGPAGTGLPARALWFGGIAVTLLAASAIAAVATLQSGRPLPFETWARAELMQRGDAGASHMATGGAAAAPMVAPAAADSERGEVDAALVAHASLEPSDVDIAGLGPILATAAVADRLAVELAGPKERVPAADIRTRLARLSPEPPRPVLKPKLAASSAR